MIYTTETIKEKNNKKETRRKILKVISFPFVIGILLLILYIGYMKFVKHENDINILGYRSYMVVTGSMEPNYNIGDLIIIKDTPVEDLKIGDVINFVSHNGKDTITHRITEIVEENGKKLYKTKGDNNNTEDKELVQTNQIKGILLFKISKLGTIITKFITGSGIIVLCILIILSYLRSSSKEQKRISREDARKLYNIPKYEKEDIV